jgi:hypothetical protein
MMRILTAGMLVIGGVMAAHAVAPSSPTLSVQVLADSVRVVAAWRPTCDVRGCADSSRVTWQVGTRTPVVRTTRRTADTLWFVAPAWGDSVRVSVTVEAMRRGRAGDPRTVATIVRRLDAPPPPVDSLRVDTLALLRELAVLAVRDSFPVVVVRDTLGGRSASIPEGTMLVNYLCAIGRNRYTGAVAVLTDVTWPDDVANATERRCERARAAYAAERSG